MRNLGVVLLLSLRLRRILIGWLKARVDHSRKRNKVKLKCGNLHRQRAIHAQDFSSITEGLLGSLCSVDGHGVH